MNVEGHLVRTLINLLYFRSRSGDLRRACFFELNINGYILGKSTHHYSAYSAMPSKDQHALCNVLRNSEQSKPRVNIVDSDEISILTATMRNNVKNIYF